MSSSQKILSASTRTTTRNGVTETVVTEVVQSPDGTIRTVTKTSTSGCFSNSNIMQCPPQMTNQNYKHDDFHKLTNSFNKLSHSKTDEKPTEKKKHNTKSESTSSDSDSSDDEDEFEKSCLKSHNHYRDLHGVPHLKLSKTLNKYATEWAQKLARENSFQHRPDHKYGENIFMKFSSQSNFKLDGKDPVDSWYSEIKDHKFGVDRPGSGSGHFTQVVWKDSKSLGVGKARSNNGKIIVVCNYDPPGNFIGRYAANVLPRK